MLRRPRPVQPRSRDGAFVNWSRTQRSGPLTWHLPGTEDEVVALVDRARAAGRRLRVVGAGHSFSGIAVPEQDAVSLDALRGAPIVAPDRATVTVSAGMRLRDLSDALAREGLALPIVGSIQAQSVGGAIATGTHGSSLRHGNLADLVTAARVVTGTGEVVSIGPDDERLHGVRVHLGALGIVTQVTLRVRAAVRLHQSIEQVPVAAVPERLAEVASSAEYVKVWWLAHAPDAQVASYDATDARPSRLPSAATRRWVDERIMHRTVFPALVSLQRRRPSMTAAVNRRLSKVYLGPPSQVGAGPLMLNTPMPLRHRETEAALPMAKAPEAVAAVLGLFRDGRPAVSFPLEIRFVRRDDAWLSPAEGADTCQIGAYTTEGPDCQGYFDDFWRVMRPLGARPHWGKELDHEAAELAGLYPKFDRFLALREEFDPQRVFGGGLVRRLLGE